jgi:hypothetical protein
VSDAATILARLDAMEAAHQEGMRNLHAELAAMRKALEGCQKRCWVGNQTQVAAAMKGEEER